MATVPAQITWTTGTVVTAAQLNTNVRDAVNFLIQPPSASLTKTGTTSLATSSSVYTAITFDTEDWDTDGGHSTSVNTSRYTAQTAGKFQGHCQLEFQSSATGARLAGFRVNGGSIYWTAEIPAVNGNTTIVMSTGFLSLAVNDYVEVVGLQNSGGTLTVNANSRFALLWMST